MREISKILKVIPIVLTLLASSGCTNNIKVEDKDSEVLVNKKEKEVVNVINPTYLENDTLTFNFIGDLEQNKYILFQHEYSDIEGIVTFRGNNYRNSPSYGSSKISSKELENAWEFKTSSSSWGGGAGWTGQPAIIRWPQDIKEKMNVSEKFKNKTDGVEVIYASLDGNIYFLDLETGEPTREKINVGNPIKGSLSIDPRGLPILYVGEGINEKGVVGFNMYSLIDGSQLFELSGSDSDAYRGWPAFDSSAIVNAETDTVVVGGENGLLYTIKLNSNYDKANNTLSIDPKISKYRYNIGNSRGRLGIENSVATYANLAYFADNNGYIQCVDMKTMKPVWLVDGSDDMDASLTIDIEDNTPFVYCGNEVDHQGSKGVSKLKKINGLTGEVVWEKEFECESLLGKKPVNGGLMATNIIGKNELQDTVVFSLARYGGFNKGLVVSLDKKTGEILWERQLDNYMWSSPVDVYDEGGKGYIVQGDSAGNMFLLDGKTGEILDTITLNGNIEASPAVFEGKIVIATRNSSIYSIKIK